MVNCVEDFSFEFTKIFINGVNFQKILRNVPGTGCSQETCCLDQLKTNSKKINTFIKFLQFMDFTQFDFDMNRFFPFNNMD